MKHTVIVLCALFALSLDVAAAPPAVASARSAGEEANILELEKQWYEMRLARDVAAIDKLVTDDVVVTNSYGRVFTKIQLLDRYRSQESFQPKSFHTDDVKVRIHGDAAVVTGYGSVDGEGPRGRLVTAVRFTRTYFRIDGRWRLVAQQATRIIR
jgi:ketosteroid isomerase-like protein